MALVEEMRNLTQDILRSHEDRATAHKELGTQGRELRRSRAQDLAHLQSEVGAMLQTFHEERETQGRELRAGLAQGEAQREARVHEFTQSLAQETAQRKAEVSTELGGVRRELIQARGEWRKLGAATQSRRGGSASEGAAPSPGMAGLGDQVFQYLANHPQGAKMTELEQELGAPRIQMAKALKGLVEANRVKKQDLLYFAV